MAKIFLGLAILFMLLSAVLGFLTKSKISDVRADLVSKTAAADSANQQLAKAQSNAKAADAKVDALQQQVAASGKGVTDAQTALDAANKEKDDMAKQTNDLKTQVADLTAKLSAAPPPTPAVAVADPAKDARIADLEKKVGENDLINKKLAQQNAALQSTVDDYNSRRKGISALAKQRALTGEVLAVQPSWNFVILSIGDRQGVTMNVPLIVQRGGNLVAKLRVTSVEPATSVADIVSSSVPMGMHVMPGDRVVYQGNPP